MKEYDMGEDNMEIIGQKQKMSISDYTEYLIDQGYSRTQLHIDENSEIVCINSLEKGSIGTVIDIRCPSRYKIIMVDKKQSLDNDHTLSTIFADNNGEEISPDTRIRILKYKTSEAMTIIDTMFYKDITRTEYLKIPPNKTKSHDKFYRFNDSIELNGEEHLKIEVVNPDRNINAINVKLKLDFDLWEEE